MKVLVSGSSGLIGSALCGRLEAGGREVHRLVRGASGPRTAAWDPAAGTLDSGAVEGFDAVVHLAGESIASGRWTKARKARIAGSRIDGTRLLAERLAAAEQRPKVLACASAVGYYGDRGDEELTEESAPGRGFLADVCRQWEAAAEPVRAAGIRLVHLRFGVVLSAGSGALKKMLGPFKLGLGGVIGNGRQYWSWVALDDAVGAIEHVVDRAESSGPVNVVAPEVPTNAEFTRTLGRVLGRPTLLPVPAFAARMALGDMAEEALLASARVRPVRLLQSGFAFRFADLEGALRHLLDR